MLCDRCGKNLPVIQITGEGSYCADCNNQMMLEKFGRDNTFHYANNVFGYTITVKIQRKSNNRHSAKRRLSNF